MIKAGETPGGVSVENNQGVVKIDEALIRQLAEYILKAESAGDRGELAITFVGTEEMAGLNKTYRGQEGPTDVLSFLLEEDGNDGFVTPVPLLGNVIICPEVAAANAAAEGADTLSEISLLVAHGVLHLLGYGHATEKEKAKMFERQAEVAQEFKERGETKQ